MMILNAKKNLGVIVSFISISIFGQGIKFDTDSFSNLLTKAKKENKLLFIDAKAAWCGPCKMMEKNIFPLASVGEFYNQNFINAAIDMEKGEGVSIAKRYGVNSYPTYLFINGDGELVTRNMGYMDEKKFLKIGEEAAKSTFIFAEMKERFSKGDRDPNLLLSLIRTYANSDYELAKKASEYYFEDKKDNVLTQDEVNYLLFFLKSVKDKNYKAFQKLRPEIEKFYNPEMVRNFENQLLLQNLWEQSADSKKKTINEEFFLKNAEKLGNTAQAQDFLNQNKLKFYELHEQYSMYEETALKYYGEGVRVNPQDLQKAAWNIAEHSKNDKALKTAAMWMERQIMTLESAENAYILSKIYARLGKKSEAIMFAENAIQIAEKTNKDSYAAQQLLKSLTSK